MIIEYIRYTIKESVHDSFEKSYSKASKYLDMSPFCLAYELSQCETEKENFILRIEWTSKDDHLNGFRKSPEFEKFLHLVKPYFNDITEMKHYRITDVMKKIK